MLIRVLVALEDADVRSRIDEMIDERDVLLNVLKGRRCTWEVALESPCDVLIVGYSLAPAPVTRSIARMADAPNAPAVVVVWDRDDPEELVELTAAGARAVLDSRVTDESLGAAVAVVIENRRDLLTKALVARRFMVRPQLSDFVSTSASMREFMKTVYRVVDSAAPLFIMGETGVGKERLARAIHGASRRSDGPFVSVNCGAIPENLLESELFGHEKGAFTGATRTQRGCFELAHGGTLLLDEIAEMPFHLQVKLLHVLQDFEIRPIGSSRTIPVDVRVMAATNRDITEEVKERRFRHDLYYRLSVVSVYVPPLRERRSDIPDLANSFVEDLCSRIGRKVEGISPLAMELLCEYAWPGNVREMINVLERAMLLCEDSVINCEDLPQEVRACSTAGGAVPVAAPPFSPEMVPDEWMNMPLKDVREAAVERFEKAYLDKLLTEMGGRIGETAKRAGIQTRSLFSKMRRYGLRKESYRAQRPRSRA